MPELHLEILPPSQKRLWDEFQKKAAFLNDHGYYLAGGSGLALQLGHRQSVDFDFFSQQPSLAQATRDWLEEFTHCVARDIGVHTLHCEADGVKVSFISAYKYPMVKPALDTEGIRIASLVDIGLMKLLALTHRATLRDYIDLAALIHGPVELEKLLGQSKKKYGKDMNEMIFLRALVAFDDVDPEMPVLVDQSLKDSWQRILREAVKKIAR